MTPVRTFVPLCVYVCGSSVSFVLSHFVSCAQSLCLPVSVSLSLCFVFIFKFGLVRSVSQSLSLCLAVALSLFYFQICLVRSVPLSLCRFVSFFVFHISSHALYLPVSASLSSCLSFLFSNCVSCARALSLSPSDVGYVPSGLGE